MKSEEIKKKKNQQPQDKVYNSVAFSTFQIVLQPSPHRTFTPPTKETPILLVVTL